MNGQPQFQVVNPLAETIREGEDIIAQMQVASVELEEAIQRRAEIFGRYRDALENYEVAETDELAEVVVMAQQKEGPLGGIATTSKAYDIALTKLKNDLRKGIFAELWGIADRYRRAHDQAQVELEQAQTRFNALRKIADVKTQVLRASTI